MVTTSQTASGLNGVCISLMILSIIAIALRFYVRKRQRLDIKADDIFALIAEVFYLAAVAIVLREVAIGAIGWTDATMTLQREELLVKVGEKTGLAFNVDQAFMFGWIKLSALFFYKRVLCVDGLRRPIDYMIWFSAVLVVLQMLTYIIFPFFHCGTHLSLM